MQKPTCNCINPLTWKEVNKMNIQSKCCKEKVDDNIAPIVVSLNDIPLEVRKKAASEPIYIAHF